MPLEQTLENFYPGQIISPNSLDEIPENNYMVYILVLDDTPIVLGLGKRNRARIIFDNSNNTTLHNFKSMLVRLYHLYGGGPFSRYIIVFDNRNEAAQAENHLHYLVGGNNINLPQDIMDHLFQGLPEEATSKLLLKLALASSYSGLSDLYKWRQKSLINDFDWNEISNRLPLDLLNWNV
ncbi:hypothetical protein [Robiginitalea aurantiaca]|uniref:GIY-YIG nuclease family protein n=1 Tax=Robiginitalea aurantiaca TaxID=3056915 RepID=A0ABT7WBG5_9FLAO|nr:hypothetical protein [Robiginitalea aurantiaca]MDM9630247.1 hypothetical protein [Robiginitalea aurantiaca]